MKTTLMILEFAPIMLGLFFFFVGVIVLFSSLRARWLARVARDWPSVPGQVTGSDIQVKTVTYYTRVGGRRTDYRPVVNYDYNVLGVPYHGNQITYGAMGIEQKDAEAMVAKYPTGSNVTVYYNPKKPQEAVLEHSDSGALFLILGGLASLVGLCVGCFGITLISSLINNSK